MPISLPVSAAAPDRVALTALSLSDFRNYRTLRLSTPAQFVVFTGPNGAGKTNILEAVSLLTPGRGLRRAAFEEVRRAGSASGWAVAATVRRGEEETRIGTGLASHPIGQEGARQARINGAPGPSSEALLEYLRILWLTPAMDGLFTGAASERRRFLDRFVLTVDPGHARRARDFERLLTQRNRLLDENDAPAWLDALETELAGTAVALASARAQTVALLSARMEAQAEGSQFPAARVSLTGDFDLAIAGRKAAEAELWYRQALAASRSRDRAAGRTLDGPHRSDLDVVFAAKDIAAALSSTGEQKALLINLLMAHAGLVAEASGMTPILLLDEVAAHLDPARRAALFQRLQALGAQCFMTGADAALFAGLPGGAAFTIIDGRVDGPADGGSP